MKDTRRRERSQCRMPPRKEKPLRQHSVFEIAVPDTGFKVTGFLCPTCDKVFVNTTHFEGEECPPRCSRGAPVELLRRACTVAGVVFKGAVTLDQARRLYAKVAKPAHYTLVACTADMDPSHQVNTERAQAIFLGFLGAGSAAYIAYRALETSASAGHELTAGSKRTRHQWATAGKPVGLAPLFVLLFVWAALFGLACWGFAGPLNRTTGPGC